MTKSIWLVLQKMKKWDYTYQPNFLYRFFMQCICFSYAKGLFYGTLHSTAFSKVCSLQTCTVLGAHYQIKTWPTELHFLFMQMLKEAKGWHGFNSCKLQNNLYGPLVWVYSIVMLHCAGCSKASSLHTRTLPNQDLPNTNFLININYQNASYLAVLSRIFRH